MLLGTAAPTPPAHVDPLAITRETLLALPEMTAAARVDKGISLSAQAKQMKLGKATLHGLESGSSPTLKTILAVLTWLQS